MGTPISSTTAKEVQELMSHVTDDGASGARFKVDGVDLLMKTGTGQIYNTDLGKYDSDYHTSSIMAAAPANDPKIMVYYGLVSPNITSYSAEPFKRLCGIRCRHVVFQQHQQMIHKSRMRLGKVMKCLV